MPLSCTNCVRDVLHNNRQLANSNLFIWKNSKMWKSQEFVEISPDVLKATEGVKIEKKTIKLQGVEIFYQESVPDREEKSPPVLMLHGNSFTSQNWVDIGTFQLIAAMGRRVVALDLPGYGRSSDGPGFTLEEFTSALKLDRPAIVSPSMTGGRSIPYIFGDPGTWEERASAYIAVAPVHTSGIQANQYKRCHIPTLHVVGRRDTVQGKIGHGAMRDLSVLPNVKTVILEEAGHACYMNQPDQWNRLVFNFLTRLEKSGTGIQLSNWRENAITNIP